MARYKLTIAYEGTGFHGWQRQIRWPGSRAAQSEELRTVQGEVERATRTVLRERITMLGASRTDAGVHARGQVCAFTSEADPDRGVGWPIARGTEALVRAINSKLPDDILIVRAEVVDPGFDPIFGALEKEYTYTILSGRLRPLWDRRLVYWTWHDLDAKQMRDAASQMVGQHDFAAFAQINHGRRTTVRTIFGCEVESASHEAWDRVTIRVRGSGFLYNMVRIIAGTLVEAGRGRISPDDITAILASKDRRRAGPTLPPEGLCLEWIRYHDTTSGQTHDNIARET